jgi:FkbM family methyltransferase
VVDTPSAELQRLLRTDARTIEKQERDVYVRLARERSGDIVLFGAGGLGRRILAGLRANDVEPLAFADNSPARQGTLVDGLRVLSAQDAAAEFGSQAIFIVSIWGANSPHRFEHTRDQLAALGCAVMVFPPICWRFAESLLPYYLQDLPHKVLEQKTDVGRAFDLWADDASRREYVSQVRLRLTADFEGLAHPVSHPQYFPDDLYSWRDDEWVVDGGAYDGDSIRMMTQLYGDRFAHVLALEPDPANFAKLEDTVNALPPGSRAKIACRALALASTPGTLHLEPTGTAASAVNASGSAGTVPVSAEPLDALLAGAVPTLIKLDIEGAEIDALLGARSAIAGSAPVVAVCVYHRQDHLWRIPLLLREYRDDYAFFLRPHNEEGWDLVCYAVPRGRLRQLNA